MSLSQREPRVRTESPESVVKLKAIVGLEIEAESRRFNAKEMVEMKLISKDWMKLEGLRHDFKRAFAAQGSFLLPSSLGMRKHISHGVVLSSLSGQSSLLEYLDSLKVESVLLCRECNM